MLYDEIEEILNQRPWRDFNYLFGSKERNNLTLEFFFAVKKVVAAKKLSSIAIDQHGNEYTVYLYMENLPIGWTNPEIFNDQDFRNRRTFKWILRIKDTPGSWYMTTLLEDGGQYPNGIVIDGGQNWSIVNFQEVLDEAKELI